MTLDQSRASSGKCRSLDGKARGSTPINRLSGSPTQWLEIAPRAVVQEHDIIGFQGTCISEAWRTRWALQGVELYSRYHIDPAKIHLVVAQSISRSTFRPVARKDEVYHYCSVACKHRWYFSSPEWHRVYPISLHIFVAINVHARK